MKIKKYGILFGLLLATLCGGARANTTNTFYLYNVASGNWNSANQRMDDNYQVGNSYAAPESAGYFVVDFSPVKQWFGSGTITTNNILLAYLVIVGSTDFHMSTAWPSHAGFPWFKMGCTPSSTNLNSLAQIMTGNNISGLYNNQVGNSTSKDTGYNWLPNGLHPGLSVDCWHYEQTLGRGFRITGACNAGTLFALFQAPRFDQFSGGGGDGQNYVWGSTGFDPNNYFAIKIWKP